MIMRWSPHVMATRRQETTNPTSRGLNDKLRGLRISLIDFRRQNPMFDGSEWVVVREE
jgi:hypothetical protein